MPWCETCSKFWNPNSVGAEGTCPSCGRQLPTPTPVALHDPSTDVDRVDDAGSDEDGEDYKAPWHFKLLVACIVAYLGWRAVQGVEWAVGRF